jgi:hypothetical protein
MGRATWTAHTDPVGDDALKVVIRRADEAIRRGEVSSLLRADPGFRSLLIATLAAAPFPAYFWETPPLTEATSSSPWEFVLVDCAQLVDATPQPGEFAARFRALTEGASVATFGNLGGDATLVAPAPKGPLSCYAHLAAFSRAAPEAQQHELWQQVGVALGSGARTDPLWLSTSGLGVTWLHVRLDSSPKYYSYPAYRRC